MKATMTTHTNSVGRLVSSEEAHHGQESQLKASPLVFLRARQQKLSVACLWGCKCSAHAHVKCAHAPVSPTCHLCVSVQSCVCEGVQYLFD